MHGNANKRNKVFFMKRTFFLGLIALFVATLLTGQHWLPWAPTGEIILYGQITGNPNHHEFPTPIFVQLHIGPLAIGSQIRAWRDQTSGLYGVCSADIPEDVMRLITHIVVTKGSKVIMIEPYESYHQLNFEYPYTYGVGKDGNF